LLRTAGRLLALGAGLTLAGSPSPAPAQPVPFSEVALHAGGNALLDAGALEPFYHASPGVEAAASTPFYAGVAGLDVGLRRFEGRGTRARENLWAVPVAVHWGVRPGPGPGGVRLEAGLRLGTFLMRFSKGGAGLRNENELLMGTEAGLSLPLGGRWRLALGARYEHVFTSTAFSLWKVRAGVRRRFDAPRWLQTLLQ
jgi:hypothetical protein